MNLEPSKEHLSSTRKNPKNIKNPKINQKKTKKRKKIKIFLIYYGENLHVNTIQKHAKTQSNLANDEN